MKKPVVSINAELEVPDDWELARHPSGISVLRVGDTFVDFDLAPLATAVTLTPRPTALPGDAGGRKQARRGGGTAPAGAAAAGRREGPPDQARPAAADPAARWRIAARVRIDSSLVRIPHTPGLHRHSHRPPTRPNLTRS